MHSCGFFKRTRRHPQTNWAVKSSVHAAKAKTKQKKDLFHPVSGTRGKLCSQFVSSPSSFAPPPSLHHFSHMQNQTASWKMPTWPRGQRQRGKLWADTNLKTMLLQSLQRPRLTRHTGKYWTSLPPLIFAFCAAKLKFPVADLFMRTSASRFFGLCASPCVYSLFWEKATLMMLRMLILCLQMAADAHQNPALAQTVTT